MNALRLGLGELIGAGGRAVSKYTGTLFTVFVAQSLIAIAVMLGIAVVFAETFAHLPMFDEAVDGDPVALVYCVRYGKLAVLAAIGIGFSGVLIWQVASWFVAGGLYGVFAARPEGRADTARCFGAAGGATFLAYARVALCALPGWTLVLFVWGIGMGAIAPRIDHALTLTQLFVPIILGTLPAGVLALYVATVSDFTRVELSLRHASHEVGVVTSYLRTMVYVIRRPLTMLHNLLGGLCFVAVTVIYVWLSQGHPMYGAGGAIMLFCLRLGVSLLRMTIRVGVLAGQVELGRTRPLPPVRTSER